jgi:hypothetical protein
LGVDDDALVDGVLRRVHWIASMASSTPKTCWLNSVSSTCSRPLSLAGADHRRRAQAARDLVHIGRRDGAGPRLVGDDEGNPLLIGAGIHEPPRAS